MSDDFPTSTAASEDDSTVFQFVMMFVLCVIAVFMVAISFLIWGAVAGEFIKNVGMRMGASLAMATLFPLLAGLGMMGRDVNSMATRWSRMFMSIAVVSLGGAALAAIFLTPLVLTGLEREPNWFLDPQEQTSQQGFPAANRKVSKTLAVVIDDVLGGGNTALPH